MKSLLLFNKPEGVTWIDRRTKCRYYGTETMWHSNWKVFITQAKKNTTFLLHYIKNQKFIFSTTSYDIPDLKYYSLRKMITSHLHLLQGAIHIDRLRHIISFDLKRSHFLKVTTIKYLSPAILFSRDVHYNWIIFLVNFLRLLIENTFFFSYSLSSSSILQPFSLFTWLFIVTIFLYIRKYSSPFTDLGKTSNSFFKRLILS